jgi:hypothetical protein
MRFDQTSFMRPQPFFLRCQTRALSPQEKPCDFSLLKAFRLTERLQLFAGANSYNVFNHPNFANPMNDISSGQFGTIQSTVAPPTSPYGVFARSAVSGRLFQLTTRLTF